MVWRTDWVEHVIATKGEPYLKIPEDEMSFIARYSLDVYVIIAACCLCPMLAAWAVLVLLLKRCKPFLLQLKSAVRRCLPLNERAHQE